ncbi:MAG: alpha-1,4-glucan--maltose-1-phosphate maltosyltransferase, partial [Pseudolabrys sp.]
LKESVDGTNAVACAIALAVGPQEFWLHFGNNLVGGKTKKPVHEIENLITGERHLLEWSGVRLRIDPGYDPALLFRCIA